MDHDSDLYVGERVGCIAVVAENETLAANTQSVLANIQRTEISNPPAWGAKVASAVLNNPELRSTWKEDLLVMSTRIRQMRQALYDALLQCGEYCIFVVTQTSLPCLQLISSTR